MKILIVSQYFWPENFRINDVCLGLKERGHEIVVLTGKPNYPAGEYYKGYSWIQPEIEIWKGIKIYRCNLLLRKNGKGLSLFLNYFSFALFATLKLFRIKEKFDKILVFAPSPITVGIPGLVARFWFKADNYLWVHDLWPESVKVAGGVNSKLILGILSQITKFIYSKTKKILIQSKGFLPYILAQNVKADKIIYYPFFAENFYKIEKSEDEYIAKLPRGFKLIFAGNIGVAQSLDTLINAALKLKNLGYKINWLVFGEGRQKDYVLERIQELGLTDIFSLMGFFPPIEMPKYFSCVDGLLVSLKKNEIMSLTIPGKVQSYLACGKPIIGSLDGVGASIIEDAEAGFTAQAENDQQLVEAIIKLYNLTEIERYTLGLNGRKYFEKEFEREYLLDKLISILNNEQNK